MTPEEIVRIVSSYGAVGAILVLYLLGKLPTIAERTNWQKELETRDRVIREQADYVKELVSLIQEQDEKMRSEIIPPLTTLVQNLPTIVVLLQKRNQE